MNRRLLALLQALSACTAGAPAEPQPGWTVLGDDLPGSVLSCHAAAPDDVSFVGTGGLLLRWDAAELQTVETGVTEWLWWVWGCGATRWMVGERGVALRWDGAAIAPVASGTTATLFGVWGPSCDEVWAVGGSPLGGGENEVVLRWDGGGDAGFHRVALPEERGVARFKVWGSGADDVFVVGDAATIWRWAGATWTRQDAGACASRLFTVHGAGPGDVFAVGGFCALHFDGEAWAPTAGLDLAGRQASGVHVEPDGHALIVGFGALKARRTAAGQWLDESAQQPYGVDFHGACADGRGGFFAVGGNFLAPASPQRGIIAHWGAARPSAEPAGY